MHSLLASNLASAPASPPRLCSQIAACNKELHGLKQQLARTRSPAQQNLIKKKMLAILQRRKLYERNASQMMSVATKMESTSMAIESAEMATNQVATIRQQVGVLKDKTAELDLDALEDAQDDLEDLMGDVDEVHEIMGRSFGMDEVSDADLDAELALIGEEDGLDLGEEFDGIEAGPGGVSDPYAMPAVPAAAAASSAGPVPVAAGTAMPAVPAASGSHDAYGGTL